MSAGDSVSPITTNRSWALNPLAKPWRCGLAYSLSHHKETMPSLFAEFLQVFPSKRKACGGFMEMKWNHFYFVVKHLYLVLLFKYLFSCLLHFQTDIVQPWKALKYALNLKSFPCIKGPEEIGVKYCWCFTTVGTFKKTWILFSSYANYSCPILGFFF